MICIYPRLQSFNWPNLCLAYVEARIRQDRQDTEREVGLSLLARFRSHSQKFLSLNLS